MSLNREPKTNSKSLRSKSLLLAAILSKTSGPKLSFRLNLRLQREFQSMTSHHPHDAKKVIYLPPSGDKKTVPQTHTMRTR